MSTARELRSERLSLWIERAQSAFKDHAIRSREPSSFAVCRRVDGKWSSTYAFSVYGNQHGSLIVSGDISTVSFGYYSDSADFISRVRWIGECEDLGYYVAQKAQHGSGPDTTWSWDRGIAIADLRERDHVAGSLEATAALLSGADRSEMLTALGSAGAHAEDIYDVGQCVSTGVVFAWAALARLCCLIDNQDSETARRAGLALPAAILGKLFDRLAETAGGVPAPIDPELWLSEAFIPATDLRDWLAEECQDNGISTQDMQLIPSRVRDLGLAGLEDPS